MNAKIEELNRKKHGDPGPFLVCARTTLSIGETKGGWVSRCIKCHNAVFVPSNLLVIWRNTGAVVVCPEDSHGGLGMILETF